MAALIVVGGPLNYSLIIITLCGRFPLFKIPTETPEDAVKQRNEFQEVLLRIETRLKAAKLIPA